MNKNACNCYISEFTTNNCKKNKILGGGHLSDHQLVVDLLRECLHISSTCQGATSKKF